jgi:hypothetical protein
LRRAAQTVLFLDGLFFRSQTIAPIVGSFSNTLHVAADPVYGSTASDACKFDDIHPCLGLPTIRLLAALFPPKQTFKPIGDHRRLNDIITNLVATQRDAARDPFFQVNRGSVAGPYRPEILRRA